MVMTMSKKSDRKMRAFHARQAMRNVDKERKVLEKLGQVETYPVELDGKTVLVTIPENEPRDDGDKSTTTRAGDGNGPVLPEDKPKRRR